MNKKVESLNMNYPGNRFMKYNSDTHQKIC